MHIYTVFAQVDPLLRVKWTSLPVFFTEQRQIRYGSMFQLNQEELDSLRSHSVTLANRRKVRILSIFLKATTSFYLKPNRHTLYKPLVQYTCYSIQSVKFFLHFYILQSIRRYHLQ